MTINPKVVEPITIVFDLIEIYRANPTKECQEPLELIYYKMNCGLHRVDILKILNDNDVLSDRIFIELEFDCNEEIRKLYRRKKTAGNTLYSQ